MSVLEGLVLIVLVYLVVLVLGMVAWLAVRFWDGFIGVIREWEALDE